MKTLELFDFCDLDWGGNVTIRRSTISYVFLLGGGTIIGLARKNQ
jgi:hypothetical protein